MINKKGILFVLSSPSGAGKTTLCKKILSLDKNLRMSISYTTRPKEGVKRMVKTIILSRMMNF